MPNNSVELVSRGRDLEVNAHNVYTYVRKYSQYRYESKCIHCPKLIMYRLIPSVYLLNLKYSFTFNVRLLFQNDHLSRKSIGANEIRPI